MRKLRKLSAAITMTLVFVMPVLAGQTMTPCPQTDPGQTMTPCDPGPPTSPGDTSTPGVNSTATADLSTVANGDTSFADFAADLLLNLLPLY